MISKNKIHVFLISLILMVIGCSADDGEDGKVFIQVSCQSRASSFTLTDLGGIPDENLFYCNTPYEVTQSGFFYWTVLYTNGTSKIYYYSYTHSPLEGKNGNVGILPEPSPILASKAGEDGKDQKISVLLNGHIINWTVGQK